MARLDIHDLVKTYGSMRALDGVSLSVDKAELVALLGPSGCGKTTILRSIAGFVPTTSGRIEVDGREITHMRPNIRNTGMVFQNYALFPNMTVAGNVAFGLKMRGTDRTESDRRVAEAIELVSLTPYAERYPRELSGGQQQRVAVARALVVNPDVFLLDEPLSNLDATLRQSVGQQLRALQQRLGLTTVFVTHDQKEALMMADRIVIMRAGRVVQEGRAGDLYSYPGTRFVAEFLGSSNVLDGKIGDEGFATKGGITIPCDTRGRDTDCVLALRPENVLIGGEAGGVDIRSRATVLQVVYLGSYSEIELELPGGDRLTAHRQNRDGAGAAPAIGTEIDVGWRADACRLLPDDTKPN